MGLVDVKAASKLFAADTSIYPIDVREAVETRLGWLDFTEHAYDSIESAKNVVEDVLKPAGVSRVVLCGMGGSGLAPAVIAAWAGTEIVLADTTNPAFLAREAARDLSDTVFICSSKSGTTVETTSHIAFFRQALAAQGLSPATHMLFITDPGTPLAAQAVAAGEQCILGKPTVGGRFSALTAFGLVPAVLSGAPAEKLVQEAEQQVGSLAADEDVNPAVQLAEHLANALPRQFILELVSDDPTAQALGMWIEQLIAESTGKHGKGILPVTLACNEKLTPPLPAVQRVRLQVCEGSADSCSCKKSPAPIKVEGLTADASEITVTATLGGHFLFWEVATALLGVLLEIDPFDQPDVESAKKAARENLGCAAVKASNDDYLPATLSELAARMDVGRDAGYLVVQAYIDMTAENATLLSQLRSQLSAALNIPVAQAFGPRYLHSTGQFHKGGPNCGIFLQLVDASTSDLAIPGQDYSYGELLRAQAAGDAAVLEAHGKSVLTLNVQNPTDYLADLLRVS